MSPGSIRHSQVTGRAFRLLDAHSRARDLGHVLTGEAGIIVARRPDTVRGADVAFISFTRLPKNSDEDGFLQQPPELVIEVFGVDATWQKMEEKVAEYHHAGVDMVWIVDPQTLALRVYERECAPRLFRDTETATADPYVPGFTVRVQQFFQD
jgi:Uma2 family endonuclease